MGRILAESMWALTVWLTLTVGVSAVHEFRERMPTNLGASLVQTSDASASDTNGMSVGQLQARIVHAERSQKSLRTKIHSVSEVAHEGLSELRKELIKAKASTKRSEEKLQSKVQEFQALDHSTAQELAHERRLEFQVRNRLASSEHAEQQLRARLGKASQLAFTFRASQAAEVALKNRLSALELEEAQLQHKLANAASQHLPQRLAVDHKIIEETQSKIRQEQLLLSKESKADNASLATLEAQLGKDQREQQHNELEAQQALERLRAQQTTLYQRVAEKKKEYARASALLQTQVLGAKQKQLGLSTELNQSVAEASHENMRVEAEDREGNQMRQELAEAQRQGKLWREELATQRQAIKELNASMAHAAADAAIAAQKANKEKTLLLNQIGELQNASKLAEAREQTARKETSEAEANAVKQSEAIFDETQKEEHDHNATVLKLQHEMRDAHMQLVKTQAAVDSESDEEEDQRANLTDLDTQLKEAMHSAQHLRDVRVRAQHALSDLRSKQKATSHSIYSQNMSMKTTKQSLAQVLQKMKSVANESFQLNESAAMLRENISSLKEKVDAIHKDTDMRLRQVMVNAAQKVRDLQDDVGDLQDQLGKAKLAVQAGKAEEDKAQDTLMQQTNDALAGAKKVTALSKEVHDMETKAEHDAQAVSELQQTYQSLKIDKEKVSEDLDDTTKDSSSLESKADGLQASMKADTKKANETEHDNRYLGKELNDVKMEAAKADDLNDEMASLRAAAAKNMSKEAAVAKEIAMLQDLKDRYSTEYESWRNESVTWHDRADEEDAKLKSDEQSLKVAVQQRDAEMAKAKEATGREDEYFQENTHLRDQSQALASHLEDLGQNGNKSAANEQHLVRLMADMRQQAQREDESSQAAWVSNQNELAQSQSKLQHKMDALNELKAELLKTRAVLNEKQRRRLGLSDKPQTFALPVLPAVAPATMVTTPDAATDTTTEAATTTDTTTVTFTTTTTTTTTATTTTTTTSTTTTTTTTSTTFTTTTTQLEIVTTAASSTAPIPSLRATVSATTTTTTATMTTTTTPRTTTATTVPTTMASTTVVFVVGEPPRPVSDAAALLASVVEPTPAPLGATPDQPAPQEAPATAAQAGVAAAAPMPPVLPVPKVVPSQASTLQKLADFFATPMSLM